MKPRSNRNLDLLLFCTLDSEDWSFVFCLLMDHGEEDETIMDTSSVILAFRICITSSSQIQVTVRRGLAILIHRSDISNFNLRPSTFYYFDVDTIVV